VESSVGPTGTNVSFDGGVTWKSVRNGAFDAVEVSAAYRTVFGGEREIEELLARHGTLVVDEIAAQPQLGVGDAAQPGHRRVDPDGALAGGSPAHELASDLGDGVLLASTICDGPVSVKAWDLESGAPLWSAVLPDSQAGGATLAIVDGVALVTTAGGLSAFDGRSGAPRPSTDASTVAPSSGEPAPGGPLLAADGVTVTAPGCPTPGGY